MQEAVGLHYRGNGAGEIAAADRSHRIDVSESSSNATTEKISPEQVKHINKYFEAVTMAVLGSLVQLCATTSRQRNANYKIFLPQVIPLMAIGIFMYYMRYIVCDGSLEAPVPYCSPQTRRKITDIGIYGSNLILMLAPLILLCVHTAQYAVLAFIPFLALLVIIFLFRQGSSFENYQEQNDTRDHFMKVSTGAALPAFAGVLGFVLNPPLLKESLVIRISECFLYCTVVISLLVMLLTSVPPKTPNLVEVLKSMCNTLLTLLMLAGLMATSEILHGFVMVAIFSSITGATIWLIKELKHEDNGKGSAPGTGPAHESAPGTGPEHESAPGTGPERESAPAALPKHDEETLLLFVASSTFGVIFYFYSNFLHYRDNYTQVQHIVLWACMLMLCSTFISSLSRMLIISNSADTRAWRNAKDISHQITHYSVLIMLLLLLGCLPVLLSPV